MNFIYIALLAVIASLFFEGWHKTEWDDAHEGLGKRAVEMAGNAVKWFGILLAIYMAFVILKTLWGMA